MRYLVMLALTVLPGIVAHGQWAVCDTMGITYLATEVKFEGSILGSYDSAVAIPIVNNTGTNFAYPQAKLINITPLPSGMTLHESNWLVFASSWNTGDTATSYIGYDVTLLIPDNFIVKFSLSVTNFAPLAVDSCIFTDTLTINLKPVTVAVSHISKESKGFTFWPDPAIAEISICATYDNAELAICSITGKVVKTFTANRQITRVNISELPAGMYLIREKRTGTIKQLIKTQ
jgi:hypothetical protein